MIIAVVGSGGKTTLIKKLASRYRSKGKTVLITTTTHVYYFNYRRPAAALGYKSPVQDKTELGFYKYAVF